VQQQLTTLAHDVFVSAYIDAMKQTLVLPIAVLVFTAFTALLIQRRARAQREAAEREEVRAAAG
jgi:hypothetical protein